MSEFKLKIRNIKGYEDIPQEITLNLNPNRLNFVVAPNGSGKTSFTTAFNCLSNGKIDVPLEWKYKKQKNATSVKLALKDWQIVAKRLGASERDINLFSQRFISE